MNVKQIDPRVDRIIKTLDDWYEFGPTMYYQTINEDRPHVFFNSIVGELDNAEVNLALNRIRSIEKEKRLRITVKPHEFRGIARMSDGKWQLAKWQFEKDETSYFTKTTFLPVNQNKY